MTKLNHRSRLRIFFPEDINVTTQDGTVDEFMETSHFIETFLFMEIFHFLQKSHFFIDQRGSEKNFRTSESLGSYDDSLSVRELESLVFLLSAFVRLHFSLVIQCDIANLFFDVSNGFEFSGWREIETDFVQKFPQMFTQISSGQVICFNGMWKSVTFVNGDCVTDTISSVQNKTCGPSWRERDSTAWMER